MGPSSFLSEHFFGLTALAMAAIWIPLSFKQRRTLVPIFEGESRICDASFVKIGPLVWLGPWARGVHYSFVLAGISFLPNHLLERDVARFDPFERKEDFMRHFSHADIRRSRALCLLGCAYLVVITLGYLLEVP